MNSPAFLSGVTEFFLSWFEGLINGVVATMSGGGSGSGLIKWLSANWLSLFTMLVIGGCVVNVIVYLIRWRPQWWWFAKKRMVVDDVILEKPVHRKPSTIVPKHSSDEDKLFGDTPHAPIKHAVRSDAVVNEHALNSFESVNAAKHGKTSLFGDETDAVKPKSSQWYDEAPRRSSKSDLFETAPSTKTPKKQKSKDLFDVN